MAPSQKPINISISSNGEELQVPNEYNEFREYIVKNNILLQNDIKKVIAYSTCSQVGYMVLITGLSHYSVSLFHVANHAVFKALLFLRS